MTVKASGRLQTNGGFGVVAKSIAGNLRTWLRLCRSRASERQALSELPDWLLNDVGISRGEADRETRKRSWHK